MHARGHGNEEQGGEKREKKGGTERAGLRGDDADEPGNGGAANAGGAEEDGSEPGGVVSIKLGDPGDVDGILRSAAETGERRAEEEEVGRLREGDSGDAEGGEDQARSGDGDLGKLFEKNGGEAAAEEKESVKDRGCDEERRGRAAKAMFVGGDPAADGDFDTDVEKK